MISGRVLGAPQSGMCLVRCWSRAGRGRSVVLVLVSLMAWGVPSAFSQPAGTAPSTAASTAPSSATTPAPSVLPPGPAPSGATQAAPATSSRIGPPWEKLGETPVLTLYMDRSSVQRDGTIRRVFEMQDLKVPDPDGVLSRRYVNEYDCDNQMHRIGRMTSWSGAALSGRKLFDVSDWGYWRKIPANGLFTVGFRLVCPLRAGEALGG